MVGSDVLLRYEFSCFGDVFVLTECVYCDQTCFTTPNIKLKNLDYIVHLYCGGVVEVYKLFVAS